MRWGLIIGLAIAALGVPIAAVAGRGVKTGSNAFLGMSSLLTEPQTGQTSYVYAADGKTLITMFYEEYRKEVSLTSMSPFLYDAIVAAEDARFYEHNGVDIQGLARAFVANQQAGSVSQGGSTLTMQYVRMALRDSAADAEGVIDATEQTPMRKLREVRIAIALEKRLTKEQILEKYLNAAYFGHRAYGAHAASQIYFSKPPSDLTLAEAATLAGLVKAPSDFDPASNDVTAAKDRRDYVLREMARLGKVTQAQADAAVQEPVQLKVYTPPNDCVSVAPEVNNWGFFCDFFKSWWIRQPSFGANPQERMDSLRRGGYKIVTTLDPNLQAMATTRIFEKEAAASHFAHGLVAVQPGTGQVKAMAVNRVYSVDQAGNGPSTDPNSTRPGSYPNTVAPLLGGGELPGYQAGSTFKFFTLMAALDAGFPMTTAFHAPQRYTSIYPAQPGPSTCGGVWCPVNASEAMTGTQNMWTGFGKSVNTYFVQLEQAVGADKAVKMAERLGLQWRTDVDKYYAAPERSAGWGPFTLGVADTTPLEMASAYATAAAEGVYCEPIPVVSISDVAVAPKCRQEVQPSVAHAATDAARCVTGYGAAGGDCGGWSTAPGVYGVVGRPVAGKTGTTDDTRAAWFVGFTPQLAAASFIADPDYPFNPTGDGNAWKPITSVSEVLRDGLNGQPVAYFPYP